jgi:hypothetical protein
MKKIIYYLLLFMLLCLLGNSIINNSIRTQLANQSPYSLSFASIGAISLESRLDCWAKLNTDSTLTDLKQEMNKILACLQLPYDASLMQIRDKGQTRALEYNIFQKKINYHISLKSDPELQETYYVITVKSTANDFRAQTIQDKLNGHPGLKWQYYTLHSGRLKERVNNSSHVEILSAVLKKFKACNVKQYREDQMMVVTAYSPIVGGNALDLNGSKCNLQAAVRNDEIERQTYIYIGSPLIIAEY